MATIASIVIGYLIGSVIFSIPVGIWLKGVDVRQYGSGNAGATNSMRVLGTGPALLVLALDIAKSVAAVWIGHLLSGGQLTTEVLAGLAAIIGHNWPLYFRFRGGKGIATTVGFVIALGGLPALYACLIGIVIIALTRYVSLGSLVGTGAFPVLLLIMGRPPILFWAAVVIFVLAVYRHRKNIGRLLKGTENKLGQKAREAGEGVNR